MAEAIEATLFIRGFEVHVGIFYRTVIRSFGEDTHTGSRSMHGGQKN